MFETVAERIHQVRERIAAAAARSGRAAEEIALVAVTKTVPCEAIAVALEAGITRIGENRVQEADLKYDELGAGVEWHLIGHLQTNKVSAALPIFEWIHSVDSVRLLSALNHKASETGKHPKILLQVNTSGEESKFGVPPLGLKELVEAASFCEGIQVEGLMTIGPFTNHPTEARKAFRLLRELADEAASWGFPRIAMRHLSMGMTHDFELAITEGATMVRIGTAIFGPRTT